MSVIAIDVCNRQSLLPVDAERWRFIIGRILADQNVRTGELSVAVVDDEEMRELNRKFLGHDYPTDVLSFVLERDQDSLEGEIVVSSHTAVRQAKEYGRTSTDELLLYLIHGALHLVGFDDKTESARNVMRQQEGHYVKIVTEFDSMASTQKDHSP